MYAIIKSGGKQYRVKKGDVIDVELLHHDEKGAHVEFGEILFVSDGKEPKVGGPNLSDWTVMGELVDFVKGPKITSVKYQPGNHYKKFGHRQKYCRVKITEVGSKDKHKEKHAEKHVEKHHAEKHVEKHAPAEKHAEKHVEKHVEKHAEKHTEKHAEKHKEKQTEKHPVKPKGGKHGA